MALSFTSEDRKTYYLFSLQGSFSGAFLSNVKDAIADARHAGFTVFVFELSSITSMDSSAIGLLANLQKNLMTQGGHVCLAALSQPAKKTVIDLKADRVFQLFATVDDAHTAFNTGLCKEERGFYALITLPEKFNVNCVSPLRELVENALNTGNNVLVFDFSRTTMVSSVGIGLMMHLQKKLQAQGGGLYIIGINTDIRHVLDGTNVLRVIQEYRTIEEVEKMLT